MNTCRIENLKVSPKRCSCGDLNALSHVLIRQVFVSVGIFEKNCSIIKRLKRPIFWILFEPFFEDFGVRRSKLCAQNEAPE